MRNKERTPEPMKVFGLIIILDGTIHFCWELGVIIFALINLTWIPTEGTIIASSIEKHTISPNTRSESTTYKPQILYSYEAENRNFTGTKLYYKKDVSTHSYGKAFKIKNKYPKGKIITVYYMAENPEKSVIKPGIQFEHIGSLIFHITFTGLGIFFFRFSKELEAYLKN